ncbi:MAG: hypothetical protein UW34_C0003G0013 [Parcubacteria group bacterium GW2011_GWA2_44_15]|nr:MAG: hypothetical protein UW34_C0003G0013 [Parcubacteria group bacterium GW2011_GWA2_44_15]
MKKLQGGFIGLIVLLVIVLIILGYYGFNVRNILNAPVVHDNLSYIWDLAVAFWKDFIVAPIIWIWSKLQGLF